MEAKNSTLLRMEAKNSRFASSEIPFSLILSVRGILSVVDLQHFGSKNAPLPPLFCKMQYQGAFDMINIV